MSFPNFQHRFPPEGTMKLYRGLVRDGEKHSNRSKINNSTSFNAALYERERMRVLEILGLLDTDKKKTVDKTSYHLGSNARKRKMISNKEKPFLLKASKQSSLQRKNNMTKSTIGGDNKNNLEQFEKLRRIYESTERKKPKQSKRNNHTPKTSKASKSTRLNPILCKDYIWHPIKTKECSGEGQKKKSQTKDVMSYYHNQYHKQNKK
jgi:hypothetical protein